MVKNKVLRPVEVEDLLHILPASGVFEMFDCNVYVNYPEHATTRDLEKITEVIQSMIHVEDIKVNNAPTEDGRYRIEIEETNLSSARTFPKREK